MSLNARYISDITIPDDSEVTPGKVFAKTWRVKNSGTVTWKAGTQLLFVGGMPMGEKQEYPVASVAPGGQTDISIPLEAPDVPGTYYGIWHLADEKGKVFGDILYVRIVIPESIASSHSPSGGSSNGRFVSDVTIPDGMRLKAGQSFTKTWRVENTGSNKWGKGYHLVHAGREALTKQLKQQLPVATPGQQVNISITLTTPDTPGHYFSDWRMQDDQGRTFGDNLYVEFNVVSEVKSSLKFRPDVWRDTIWAITSIFESGRPEGRADAYQTQDAGIISYGKHQATLGSGTLNQVMKAYFQRSSSPTSQKLKQEYAERIRAGDKNLRDDAELRRLLLEAAREPAMEEAQDAIFDQNFYQPAINRAKTTHVSTPLGLACLYDTKIQGGMDIVLKEVTNKLGGTIGETGPNGPIDEETWIRVFLDLREARLHRLADRYEAEGNEINAKWLRTSIFRVDEHRKLLQMDNLNLEGNLLIRGQSVSGISAT